MNFSILVTRRAIFYIMTSILVMRKKYLNLLYKLQFNNCNKSQYTRYERTTIFYITTSILVMRKKVFKFAA